MVSDAFVRRSWELAREAHRPNDTASNGNRDVEGTLSLFDVAYPDPPAARDHGPEINGGLRRLKSRTFRFSTAND